MKLTFIEIEILKRIMFGVVIRFQLSVFPEISAWIQQRIEIIRLES